MSKIVLCGLIVIVPIMKERIIIHKLDIYSKGGNCSNYLETVDPFSFPVFHKKIGFHLEAYFFMLTSDVSHLISDRISRGCQAP